MPTAIYLLTPPFTQLNTPYPATAYLKGFLQTQGIKAYQSDLGIEVILSVFSRQGLTDLFAQAAAHPMAVSPSANIQRITQLQQRYIQTINPVMAFLQGKNPTFAYTICQAGFLPRAGRFEQLEEDLSWAFGSMGIQDQAKHLATLYLEDIGDWITECIDPHFGFSRYAERLGRSAASFDALHDALQAPPSYIDRILLDLLRQKIEALQPPLVAVSVPFPGNLYAAFRCAAWIKAHHPQIKTAMGGGFANTELRSVSDRRVFDYFDYITLDDGEAPLLHLLEHLQGSRPVELLKRTFCVQDQQVQYINGSLHRDFKQSELGCPDYSDLPLDQYISVAELINPMHRLWSDGRWNKLTMAHGCYWGKCTFCDISLDYIKNYEPATAALLCDRIETLIEQTGQTGFHFVDEAAPPALMRSLALEILRRGLAISWWTNIRFEKSFSRDLCQLLRASGCMAVSGGLEVASDRLLQQIQKGVTVAQVAQVCRNFTEADIMVHAYLMYGFPTQTAQETIDSLEMVRQLFEAEVLQSGFWHLFAMTAHSPVGMQPEAFQVQRTDGNAVGTFANNDLPHHDPQGADHEAFSYGLRKSLLNFMHAFGLDQPLQSWFDFRVPKTQIPKNYIAQALRADETDYIFLKPTTKLIWIQAVPSMVQQGKKRGLSWWDTMQSYFVALPPAQLEWTAQLLGDIAALEGKPPRTVQDIKAAYQAAGFEDFELFWHNQLAAALRYKGLLCL